MINNSGLDFTDISTEQFRAYTFAGGNKLVINKPLWLNVSPTGGHRILDAANYSYYIQPAQGWYIQWSVLPGQPNFVK